jgi:hypothetical protein
VTHDVTPSHEALTRGRGTSMPRAPASSTWLAQDDADRGRGARASAG